MKRLFAWVLALPIAVVAVTLAVANRKPVTLSLDPFNPEAPALAVSLPLFAVVFGALIVGVIAGGTVVWLRQGRARKEARAARKALKEAAASAPPASPAVAALSLPSPR